MKILHTSDWHLGQKFSSREREEEHRLALDWLAQAITEEEIDLLIVDRIGKNISGSGMDPNVTNRWVQGYIGGLMREGRPAPFIRRIFVRDVTPESHGNAIGIGLADVTTTRLVRAMDPRVTGINALTSLTPQTAKIPIAFDTDREAVERTLQDSGASRGAPPSPAQAAERPR